MSYSLTIIPVYIFTVHLFLIHISNSIPSGYDKTLIAFVRNDQEMQISEYSKQKYEAYLGIVYFMRKNWQCDKIANEVEEHERAECQKYRKYLDILYDFLNREYALMPTVMPKFVFKYQIEINGPIIYAVNCLVRISRFYFIPWYNFGEYKLNEWFNGQFEPKLLNEVRLNYGEKFDNQPKMPINEMLLQLAIGKANEWETNESLDGIIHEKMNKKFEGNLEEMFKKAEERAKEDKPWNANEINADKHKIIVESKFDDKWTWNGDALFSEFVKGLATNFETFFKMAKEYSDFGFFEIEKLKEHLMQKYDAFLGLVYLMRENWQCAEIVEELKEYERKECQKYRKYLDILYEYLFRLYAEDKNPKVSKQLPPLVKPIFIKLTTNLPSSLIIILQSLNKYRNVFGQKRMISITNWRWIC